MSIRLGSPFILFLLFCFCDRNISLWSSPVPEEDILRKDGPKKKKEVFKGFSNIFESEDKIRKTGNKRLHFFSMYFGRDLFNYTFSNYKSLFDKFCSLFKGEKNIYNENVKKEGFDYLDAFYYRGMYRFLKNVERLFFDVVSFFIFKRAFLFRDFHCEYSVYLGYRVFFTAKLGWEYNDYTFDYRTDINTVKYEGKAIPVYDLDMPKTDAVKAFGEKEYDNVKSKTDLKYYGDSRSVEQRNASFFKNCNSLNSEIGDNDAYIFVSLSKWLLSLGFSYYSNPRDPANSAFFFKALIKTNAFYTINSIDYIIADKRDIHNFKVGDVLDKCIDKPNYSLGLSLCCGYKNWEIEICFSLYTKSSDERKGKFYSDKILKRYPISIALQNRVLCL